MFGRNKRATLDVDREEFSMIAGIVYAIGGVVEALVALRFVFRLIGANPANAFVDFIYTWSTPIVAPFSGIFGQDATVVSGIGAVTTSVFDWTALIALFVLGILFGIVGMLFGRR